MQSNLDKDSSTQYQPPRMNNLDSSSKFRQFVLKSSNGFTSASKLPNSPIHSSNTYIPLLNGLEWSLADNFPSINELVFEALLIRANINSPIDDSRSHFESTSLHVHALKQQVVTCMKN